MTARKDDVKAKVKELREKGYTFAEIGRLLKLTRQRVHQIYKTIPPEL